MYGAGQDGGAGREVPMQRGRGWWDYPWTRWGCGRHWPKSHQAAGGGRCGQAAAGQGGTFCGSPGSSPARTEHRWVKGVVGREGVGGEEEKGSRLLLPFAPRAGLGPGGSPVPVAAPSPCPPRCRPALAASLALRGPTHGSGSGGCHDGSHQQNRWQLDPRCGVLGSATSGDSCLSKHHKSKPELSHRLGISAPLHPGAGGEGGSRQRPAFIAGDERNQSRDKCWGLPHVPTLPRAPNPRSCSSHPLRAASRGAPSPCPARGCLCQAGRTPTRHPQPLRGGSHGMKEPARSGRETWQKDDGAALDAFPPG